MVSPSDVQSSNAFLFVLRYSFIHFSLGSMDYGHEVGHHWDAKIETYRGALEAMLGNASSSTTQQTSQSTTVTPTPNMALPIPANVHPSWIQKIRDFGHDGVNGLRGWGEQGIRDLRGYAGEQTRDMRSYVNEHGITVNLPVDLTPNPNDLLATGPVHPDLNRGLSFHAGAGNGQGLDVNVNNMGVDVEKGGIGMHYGTVPYAGGRGGGYIAGGGGGNGNGGRPISGQSYGGQPAGLSGYGVGGGVVANDNGFQGTVPALTMMMGPGGIGADSARMGERARMSMH